MSSEFNGTMGSNNVVGVLGICDAGHNHWRGVTIGGNPTISPLFLCSVFQGGSFHPVLKRCAGGGVSVDDELARR
jgi:hypothetical protein